MDYFRRFRTEAPKHFQTILQFLTYKSLNELQIGYECLELEENVSAQDRPLIEQQLEVKMAKTLLFKQPDTNTFFLFVTTSGKDFDEEEFCKVLQISSVIPASEQEMTDILETSPESLTLFSILLDSAEGVRIVMDKQLAETEEILFRDGSNTGYLKIRTADVLERLIPHTGHRVDLIGTIG